MKVTVYVNHEDEAVITEKEYFERLNKATEETAKDNFAFEEWVNDYYSAYVMFGQLHPKSKKKFVRNGKTIAETILRMTAICNGG